SQGILGVRGRTGRAGDAGGRAARGGGELVADPIGALEPAQVSVVPRGGHEGVVVFALADRARQTLGRASRSAATAGTSGPARTAGATGATGASGPSASRPSGSRFVTPGATGARLLSTGAPGAGLATPVPPGSGAPASTRSNAASVSSGPTLVITARD